MESREELETKGVSQLMAERQGMTPRGAFSKSTSFVRAGDGQDLSTFKNMAKQYSNDNYENEIKDTLSRAKLEGDPELDDLEYIIRDGQWATDAEADAVSKFLKVLGKDERKDLASKLRAAIDSGDGDIIRETAYNVGAASAFMPGGDKEDYSKAVKGLKTDEKEIDTALLDGQMDAEHKVYHLPKSIQDKIIPKNLYKEAVRMERQPTYPKSAYLDQKFGNAKKDIQEKLNKGN